MKFEEAVGSLEAAIKVLETRVSNLRDKKEPMEEAVREKEIAEVESLIPEIKEKITDTKEMKTEALRKMKEAVGFALSSGKIHIFLLMLRLEWGWLTSPPPITTHPKNIISLAFFKLNSLSGLEKDNFLND